MGYEEQKIEGRNAVLEAFRSGKTIDKLFVLDGCQDGPVRTIVREARKHDTIINFVDKERLDQLSETKKHQGVIAVAAAYEYAEVEDILKNAEEKGEPPFIFILDNIEDPHNLGAIIRTANLAGAHGVIIPKRRAVGLTSTVAKTSAGAINYMLLDSSIKYLSRNCKIWEEYATISTEKVVTVYGSKFSELKIPYNTVVMVNFVDLKCEASEKRWSGSYKGEVRCWRTQKNGWQKMSFVI